MNYRKNKILNLRSSWFRIIYKHIIALLIQNNCVQMLPSRISGRNHSICNVGCLPDSFYLRQQSSVNITAREGLLYVPSPSTWAFSFFLNRGYDWSTECWKSFEKGKQKVSSAVMKHPSQETGPGPDSTFHTIAGQQCNKPCPLIVLEHATAVENHI